MNWTDYFAEKIKTVPGELREAILAVDFLGGLRLVQKKFLLHIDQGNELEGAAFQFMFGDIATPDLFKKTVTEKLRIPDNLSTSILNEVEEKVLSPIREKLKEIEDRNIEDEVYDELIFGKKTIEDFAAEAKKEQEMKEKNIATLKTDAPEDHSALTQEDILNEIENPTPAPRKTVNIESNIAQPQSVSQTSSQPDPKYTMGVTTYEDIASGFGKKPSEIYKPKESVQKTAAVLQTANNPELATSQKISEVTTSKPKEINISSDPYRETF